MRDGYAPHLLRPRARTAGRSRAARRGVRWTRGDRARPPPRNSRRGHLPLRALAMLERWRGPHAALLVAARARRRAALSRAAQVALVLEPPPTRLRLTSRPSAAHRSVSPSTSRAAARWRVPPGPPPPRAGSPPHLPHGSRRPILEPSHLQNRAFRIHILRVRGARQALASRRAPPFRVVLVASPGTERFASVWVHVEAGAAPALRVRLLRERPRGVGATMGSRPRGGFLRRRRPGAPRLHEAAPRAQ